jgi:hypothetical protein
MSELPWLAILNSIPCSLLFARVTLAAAPPARMSGSRPIESIKRGPAEKANVRVVVMVGWRL